MNNNKIDTTLFPLNYAPSRSAHLSFRFNHFSNEYDLFLNGDDVCQSVPEDVLLFIVSHCEQGVFMVSKFDTLSAFEQYMLLSDAWLLIGCLHKKFGEDFLSFDDYYFSTWIIRKAMLFFELDNPDFFNKRITYR